MGYGGMRYEVCAYCSFFLSLPNLSPKNDTIIAEMGGKKTTLIYDAKFFIKLSNLSFESHQGYFVWPSATLTVAVSIISRGQ